MRRSPVPTQLRPFSVNELQYELPDELIAQQPMERRDAARLLVVDRKNGRLADAAISDLPSLLEPGDLLVLNDTRVLPARLTARRQTGGLVRGLFLSETSSGRWHVMFEGSRRLRPGETLVVESASAEVVRITLEDHLGGGRWRITVDPAETATEVLARIGTTPLPPYIRRTAGGVNREREDRRRYQTVYARCPGAIAAPTAGLHFTNEMLDAMRQKGVETATVTLHVGLGTFKPVSVACLSQHTMHSESYELTQESVAAVRRCRDRGRKVVAVGTTSVRALESAVNERGVVEPAGNATTDLMIYPPFEFQVVDALLTNFHLPLSTLLALVMAMGGVERVRLAYDHAIAERYRFYSFGDAMLIL